MSASDQPWIKFYPADWRADPMLRVCSIAARGLWMEMLCLMHEAEPRGSLLIAGKQVTEAQLAALVGISRKQATSLIFELEQANVFSRDEDKTIFSRRMRRDVAKAERDKANGKAGGNPNLKRGVNPPDKAQSPEPRTQTSLREDARENFGPDEPSKATSKRRQLHPDFDTWYEGYPHKVGRGAAEKAFARVMAGGNVTIEEMVAARDRYVKTKNPDHAWCNPETWLNQRRWLDQPATSLNGSVRSSHEGKPTIDFGGGIVWPEPSVINALRRWQSDPTSWPSDRIGPPPGSPGCRVPDRLLEAA